MSGDDDDGDDDFEGMIFSRGTHARERGSTSCNCNMFCDDDDDDDVFERRMYRT